MATPVERPYNAARALLNAVVSHYRTCGVPLPDRQYVADGTPAWDCEQVTVQMERTFNGVAGIEDVSPLECLVIRNAVYVIEIVRCVPVVDDGDPPVLPTPDELDESGHTVLSDSSHLVNAVVDAFRAGDLAGCKGLTIVDWENAEPQGGFGGGRLRIYWQLTEGP